MPTPIGLVVKNGSNDFAITSDVFPVPLSDTQTNLAARIQFVQACRTLVERPGTSLDDQLAVSAARAEGFAPLPGRARTG